MGLLTVRNYLAKLAGFKAVRLMTTVQQNRAQNRTRDDHGGRPGILPFVLGCVA